MRRGFQVGGWVVQVQSSESVLLYALPLASRFGHQPLQLRLEFYENSIFGRWWVGGYPSSVSRIADRFTQHPMRRCHGCTRPAPSPSPEPLQK
jgi:hypothetical protein